MRQLSTIVVVLVVMAMTACGQSSDSSEAGHPLTGAVPEGVDAAVWQELSDELARQLARKGASAAADITDDRFRITDFELTQVEPATGPFPNGSETLTFSWTYRNHGDYNLDGEVNATDLAPIAKYLYVNAESPDWDRARLADGNGDGEVNAADIATISAQFGNRVNGYLFGYEFLDTDGNDDLNAADLTAFSHIHRTQPAPSNSPAGSISNVLGIQQIGISLFGPHKERFLMVHPGRVLDGEEAGPFLPWFGMPTTASARSLENGSVRYSVRVGTVRNVSSIHFVVAPYQLVIGVIQQDGLGQLSETIQHFVTPYAEPEE